MKIDSLDKLLEDEMKDLYSAENQLLKALPKMAKAAKNAAMQRVFADHLKETEGQVTRPGQRRRAPRHQADGQQVPGHGRLAGEGKKLLEAEGPDAVIDAALIAAAQRVEHYEIAGYGTARAFAERLGHATVAKLPQRTLDEESAADEQLSGISLDEVLPQSTNGQNESEQSASSRRRTARK